VSAITGIELGPDACVLVRTGRRGLGTTVAGARTITKTEWIEDREGLTGALRRARRAHNMPSRARVVAWEKADAQSDLNVGELSDLSPILMAGFEIDAILSPAEALVDLVRARQLDTMASAVAAVSLNTRGAAIAIVSKGKLISSRNFEWPLGRAFRQSRSELLERYLLVSQLAPQLKHLIELVRPVYGARVSSVLVSGTIPNLRSLSMLLIEELDIEVETLDSTEFLEPNLSALTETVAGLQLATAAATEPEEVIIEPAPVPARTRDRGASTLAMLAFALVAAWSYLQVSGVSRVVPVLSAQEAAILAGTVAPPPVTDLRIESTMGRIGVQSAPPPASSPVAPTAVPAPPPRPVASAPEPPRPRLPRVDGLMISSTRSLAIVDGIVVAPGDRVGGRIVVRIDRDGVVLREPSGREVHVAIRTRKPSSGGTEPRAQP
jgi:hypothetical protein